MSGQLDSEKENDGAQQRTGDLYRKVHQQDQLRKLQEQLEEHDR